MPIHALTIFLGALLLFLVQPIIAKQILPWFGGSSAVWATCLVFFQCALLLGYAYAHWLNRALAPKRQAALHALLLAASLLALPIIPGAAWKPVGGESPAFHILGLLTVTIGLPYLVLAATGPLVQSWFVRRFPGGTVYRLFALSNFGSLAALLAYPTLIETTISTRQQTIAWSAIYLVFVLSLAAVFFDGLKDRQEPAQPLPVAKPSGKTGEAPTARMRAVWLALSALGTWMLLAVTNHVTQNIASVPFLWIVPLTIYLVTFILCFEGRGWYNRPLVLGSLAVAMLAMAWGLYAEGTVLHLRIALPLYCVGLFLCCMFYHGELAGLKPPPAHLTGFYLMLSLGGALGGILVGIVAPLTLDAFFELGIGLVLTGLMAVFLLRSVSTWAAVTALVVTSVSGVLVYRYVDWIASDARVLTRNFYGVLRVEDIGVGKDPDARRRLQHGVIVHGSQLLAPDRRQEPTTYYGRYSGVGVAIRYHWPANVRVGLVGLGAGTVAAFARPGDLYRFYELDPQVVSLAEREFTFISDARARGAKVETVLGDARLNLEREPPGGYDVLVIDAFSGDSIPIHLITREALAVYARQIKPGGIVAFHITNRYLNLAPVLKKITEGTGAEAILLRHQPSEKWLEPTSWVLVTNDAAFLSVAQPVSAKIKLPEGLKPWTDDFNNLWQVLR